MDLIWTEKYRPKSLQDYYMAKSDLEVIKDWIKDFEKDEYDGKPFLVLYGTPGIGKTTLATLIFQKYGYEIIECNASDTRSKKQLKESLGGIARVSVAANSKGKFKPTAIIMDEIDGLVGNECGGVQELIDIVVSKDKKLNKIRAVCPVICTTNSIKEKKLQPLLKLAVVISMKKPKTEDLFKLISKISREEKITIPDNIRDEIITNANGDYRQVITLLNWYHQKLKLLESGDVSGGVSSGVGESIEVDGIDVKSDGDIYKEEDEKYCRLLKDIINSGETPLDRINYFLTHKTDIDVMRYFSSGDSNLFFMNFYNNIISIIAELQNKLSGHMDGKDGKDGKDNKSRVKSDLLKYYRLVYEIYDIIKCADIMNDPIFIDKYWDLLDYFDCFSIGFPCIKLFGVNKCISNGGISNGGNDNSNGDKLAVRDFSLTHHTQYNFMRQEQSQYRKRLNIDYYKTFDNDVINAYYNLKRFQIEKSNLIKPVKSKKSKNVDAEVVKYQIDRSYLKILDKIDDLLE